MKVPVSSMVDKIQSFIHPEYYFIMWLVLVAGYLFYKVFLKQITSKRHNNLKDRFRTTAFLLLASTVFSIINWIFISFTEDDLLVNSLVLKLYALFLFLTLTVSAVTFVKQAQILAYLYLFFMNMRVGIPRLIANLFTFVFSLVVVIYLLSEVFLINLTAMVATSAVFSIVLGLALQDTLGNLFSGVALQIGNPFTIGDWVEVQNGGSKWVGQVQEITWRATFISTFANELIMIPNKIMAQSQILIYSNNIKQVSHSQVFRFDFGVDIEKIKTLFVEALKQNPDLVQDPGPKVLVTEITESWVTIKVFYSLEDFSRKFSIGDSVISAILEALNREKIPLANNKITYTSYSS